MNLFGFDIIETSALPDGRMLLVGVDPLAHAMFLGTGPWTEQDILKEQAQRIVRNGLADVLEWLGQKVGPPVDAPIPLLNHQAIKQGLAEASSPLSPNAFHVITGVVA